MAWSRLPLDRSTVAKCGISEPDLDELAAAIQERLYYLKNVSADDAFSNGFIHANRWLARASGGGSVPTESSGNVTCVLPDTDLSSPFSECAVTRYNFTGDFDVQVDWGYTPSVNNVLCILNANFYSPNGGAAVGRTLYGGVQKYRVSSGNFSPLYFDTADTSGTFRMTRSGTTVNFYTDGTLRKTDTSSYYSGVVRFHLELYFTGSKSAGWGGASCTFDNFAVSSGTYKWRTSTGYLDDISLTDVSAFDPVWPVSAINNYRSALEDITPYFFDDAAGSNRYTKASCLTTAFGQSNWRNEPLTPTLGDTLTDYSYHAWLEHVNDMYAVCNNLIYLPLDSDSVDGFGNPGWTYEA